MADFEEDEGEAMGFYGLRFGFFSSLIDSGAEAQIDCKWVNVT